MMTTIVAGWCVSSLAALNGHNERVSQLPELQLKQSPENYQYNYSDDHGDDCDDDEDGFDNGDCGKIAAECRLIPALWLFTNCGVTLQSG